MASTLRLKTPKGCFEMLTTVAGIDGVAEGRWYIMDHLAVRVPPRGAKHLPSAARPYVDLPVSAARERYRAAWTTLDDAAASTRTRPMVAVLERAASAARLPEVRPLCTLRARIKDGDTAVVVPTPDGLPVLINETYYDALAALCDSRDLALEAAAPQTKAVIWRDTRGDVCAVVMPIAGSGKALVNDIRELETPS